MEPRPYLHPDRDACLSVFDSNALDGRDEFEHFLDSDDLTYFTVLEHEGGVAGCGGFSIEHGVAILHYGMIRSDVQRMGLGRFLLLFRLRQISKSEPPVQFVRVTTTTKWAPFYEKQGFKRSRPSGEGAAIEFHMKLTVCA